MWHFVDYVADYLLRLDADANNFEPWSALDDIGGFGVMLALSMKKLVRKVDKNFVTTSRVGNVDISGAIFQAITVTCTTSSWLEELPTDG